MNAQSWSSSLSSASPEPITHTPRSRTSLPRPTDVLGDGGAGDVVHEMEDPLLGRRLAVEALERVEEVAGAELRPQERERAGRET